MPESGELSEKGRERERGRDEEERLKETGEKSVYTSSYPCVCGAMRGIYVYEIHHFGECASTVNDERLES